LRDHQNESPISEPAVVPMKKPKMVERKVKLMSTQASPSVKKISMVFQTAVGCDQKKALIQPNVAATSQSAMMPTRMPICAETTAQVGQMRCTGRRRAGLRTGAAASSEETPTARVSCTAIRQPPAPARWR
jgi:hypothetical protein